MTQKGRPIAMLKSLDDDAHVNTRLCQYEALNDGKGVQIAKQLILSKIESQNVILEKYGLEVHDSSVKDEIEQMESSSLESARRRLISIEAKYSKRYFSQIFELFPENLRPATRETFLAYDRVNNTFNLAYEFLKRKVHMAIIKARLEPYLGFLHSVQFGKPSLVCDFLIEYCQELKRKDFTVKSEKLSRSKRGKREYSNDLKTSDLMRKLNRYFEGKVEIPRIKHGMRQTLETLICEEALLLAEYLRSERDMWIPRITFNLQLIKSSLLSFCV